MISGFQGSTITIEFVNRQSANRLSSTSSEFIQLHLIFNRLILLRVLLLLTLLSLLSTVNCQSTVPVKGFGTQWAIIGMRMYVL